MKLLRGLLRRNRTALYPGAPRVPEPLMREAFAASGEKRFGLSKFFYSRLLGPDWDYALLGFSYVKCIDNVVDVDPDPERAIACLQAHRRLLEGAYAGPIERELPSPERFGYVVFRRDAESDSPLRSCFEDVLEVMEFDVHRRGRALPAAELERHLVATGEPGIRFLFRFASPRLEVPPSYLALVSRAYLWADSLLDLGEDLEHGIINIAAEDVERFALTPALSDPRLGEWVAAQSGKVMGYFRQALARTGELNDPSLEVFSHVYLRRKQKRLLRFLDTKGIRYER